MTGREHPTAPPVPVAFDFTQNPGFALIPQSGPLLPSDYQDHGVLS